MNAMLGAEQARRQASKIPSPSCQGYPIPRSPLPVSARGIPSQKSPLPVIIRGIPSPEGPSQGHLIQGSPPRHCQGCPIPGTPCQGYPYQMSPPRHVPGYSSPGKFPSHPPGSPSNHWDPAQFCQGPPTPVLVCPLPLCRGTPSCTVRGIPSFR